MRAFALCIVQEQTKYTAIRVLYRYRYWCRTVPHNALLATCNQVLPKTGITYATLKDTLISVKLARVNMSCSPGDHRGTMIINWILLQVHAPGPHGWFHSLQIDKRPPGSKIRYRGLNPSTLGTRSGANFVIFSLFRSSQTLDEN
jgi:hypothetical protein